MSRHRFVLMISLPRSHGAGCSHHGGSAASAVELEQFETQRFELGQHSVQRCLVDQRSGEYRLRSVCLRTQAGERVEQHAAQPPADADLVPDRSGHFIHDVKMPRSMFRPGRELYFMVPPGWVSRHRAILVIRDGAGCACGTHARSRVRDARPTDDLESRVYARLDGMLMDPETGTIRSAAADPAPVLLNLPPA